MLRICAWKTEGQLFYEKKKEKKANHWLIHLNVVIFFGAKMSSSLNQGEISH